MMRASTSQEMNTGDLDNKYSYNYFILTIIVKNQLLTIVAGWSLSTGFFGIILIKT